MVNTRSWSTVSVRAGFEPGLPDSVALGLPWIASKFQGLSMICSASDCNDLLFFFFYNVKDFFQKVWKFCICMCVCIYINTHIYLCIYKKH